MAMQNQRQPGAQSPELDGASSAIHAVGKRPSVNSLASATLRQHPERRPSSVARGSWHDYADSRQKRLSQYDVESNYEPRPDSPLEPQGRGANPLDGQPSRPSSRGQGDRRPKAQVRRSRIAHDDNLLEDEQELDEVAAPSPLASRQEPGLEQSQHKHTRSSSKGELSSTNYSSRTTLIFTFGHLIFWSLLGTLARLGVQWITFYPGAPIVFSNVWANFGGTLIMGFLLEDRQLFFDEWGSGKERAFFQRDSALQGSEAAKARHRAQKKTIPLYIGLTVGFCGSFTSFSTFMRDVFLALANRQSTPLSHPADIAANESTTNLVSRNGGYSFEATVAVIVITVALSLGALYAGAHFSVAAEKYTPVLPFRACRRFLDPLTTFLGIGCWIGAVVMAAVPPDRLGGPAYRGHAETWRGQALFALVFAPLGTLVRFTLSIKLNALVAQFPLGTFAANISGTAVLGMAYVLQRSNLGQAGIGGGLLACQVLQGIEDGFCGCLTTVSTWAVELTTLSRKHAYFYGLMSIAVGLGLLVVIVGSVLWSIGLSDPMCTIPLS